MEFLSSRREREAPGGRARENRKFTQAPSPEICRKTISGGEGEVAVAEVGGRVLGYLLGKNFRRRDRDQLSFRSGAREASGSETARLPYAARRCGGSFACCRWRGGIFPDATDPAHRAIPCRRRHRYCRPRPR